MVKDIFRKLALFILNFHKWHKDWLGCWICEKRIKIKSSLQKPR